ncbi:MAG: methyltransferase domain-containing protein [Deltaproteobacteria bacterium]|nr:methyltransferase domain-containing protein [Deltaproteobacteria bacterium]
MSEEKHPAPPPSLPETPAEAAEHYQDPAVAALLAEIEASLAEKKARGEIDPAEVRRVEAMEVTFQQSDEDGAPAELMLRQANLTNLWDATQWGVTTHRSGAAGRAVTLLKKIIFKLTNFPLKVWLARQVNFNDQLIKLTGLLVPQHNDLRHRATMLERNLEREVAELVRQIKESRQDQAREVAHRQRTAETRLDALEEAARRLASDLGVLSRESQKAQQDLGSRVGTLEREASRGNAHLEDILARFQKMVAEQASRGLAPSALVAETQALRAKSRGSSYLAFEDLHRGSREEIKARQQVYLPLFQEAVTPEHPLLDLGCGRGEFLETAGAAGLAVRGLDINPEMVALCRENGLEAEEGDAVEYLRGLPDNSLGGILLAQVIEHLPVDDLTELVGLAAAKLAPGGVLAAETVNPQCLTTFSGAFYLDLTHIKPIHPEAARFLWRSAGLGDVEVIYLSPYPPDHRLESFLESDEGLAGAFNRNILRLNQLLYSYQDYAVVGRK